MTALSQLLWYLCYQHHQWNFHHGQLRLPQIWFPLSLNISFCQSHVDFTLVLEFDNFAFDFLLSISDSWKCAQAQAVQFSSDTLHCFTISKFRLPKIFHLFSILFLVFHQQVFMHFFHKLIHQYIQSIFSLLCFQYFLS